MPARSELGKVLVELELIAQAELDEYVATTPDVKPGTLWKRLREDGFLNQPQCDSLVMAEKGYITIDAARVTVDLHRGFRLGSAAPSPPPSGTRTNDTVDLDPSELSQTRRSRLRIERSTPSALSDSPVSTPVPPRATRRGGKASDTTQLDLDTYPEEPPAAAPAPPPRRQSFGAALAGKRLGKFHIVNMLGRGACGIVFLAHHTTLDIPIALKVLDPALSHFHPEMTDRFLREARTAARVNHPNVVRILDCDEYEGYHAIAMEYVEGVSVSDLLHMSGPLPEGRGLAITLSVATGLEAALEAGIIHRDVKPANIMMTKTNQVKLTDLGLGKLIGGSPESMADTSPNVALGTPYFFAPEQARDAANVDHRADIYALGATLYNILIGDYPFLGKAIAELIAKHEMEPVVPPRVRNPRITARTSDLVVRMMAKSPNDRPANYRELVVCLQECISAQAFEASLANEAIAAGTKPPASLASRIGSLFKR